MLCEVCNALETLSCRSLESCLIVSLGYLFFCIRSILRFTVCSSLVKFVAGAILLERFLSWLKSNDIFQVSSIALQVNASIYQLECHFSWQVQYFVVPWVA